MQELILTVGISGSGKTHWAEKFVHDNPLYVNVNRDDCRTFAHCGMDPDKYKSYRFSEYREDVVTQINRLYAETALSAGRSVIISDTNLNPDVREYWKGFAEEKGVSYKEKAFDVPLHVCLKNNRMRDRTLPEKVLRDQYRRFREYRAMPVYLPDETRPKALICDLDGTLFHMNERSPFDFDRVDEDTVDSVVQDIVQDARARGYDILIFTGREDIGECRAKTLKALEDAGIFWTEFLMRPTGCHDADVLVKERMLWSVADKYNIEFALDDRDQVVDLWRSLGIKCLQVGYGDF